MSVAWGTPFLDRDVTMLFIVLLRDDVKIPAVAASARQ